MIKRLFLKCFAYTIGRLQYNAMLYKGRYFEKNGIGWGWVFKCFFYQKIVRRNRAPWPVSPYVRLNNWKNIIFDINDLHIFHTYGTYFQTQKNGKIFIGKGSYIAPNVGLITSNHDINQLSEHTTGKDIVIGENCWIGMNAVILPGVNLGNKTIVGAGAVVTKSFPEGNCVIGGNPAKVIKTLV